MVENNNHNKNNRILINPFSPQYPANPAYFADRRQHLAYFTQTIVNSAKIRPPAPSNFMILGDWGMGKTSLVYKMKEVVLNDLRNEINGFCFHFSLDPVCCRSWEDFSLAFLTQLRKNYETSASLRERVVKELSTWKISVSVPLVSVEKKGNKDDNLSLIDSLENLWKKHLVPAKVDTAVLFMDDVHYFLLVGQPDAYYTIRNTFQELARRGCNFSLVMTGPKLLFKDVADIAEPFTRFFHQFSLEPFALEGTREAINKRIEAKKLNMNFSKEAIALIQEKSSGHPYFVMFIAYELLNLVGNKNHIMAKDFEESWPHIVTLLERNVFVNRLGEVSDKEKQVLLQIAQLNKDQFSPSDIKGIGGVTQFFSRIERKGLLVKKERGLYELFHPLFEEYLQKVARS
jgi:Cdc6-like AAA superfamily ATPase